MVYAKPFCIVYGTLTEEAETARLLFQSATYLANANVAAHLTFVPLFSDVEYVAALAAGQLLQTNVIFIGGAQHNRAIQQQQRQQEEGVHRSPVLFTEDAGGFIVDDQFTFPASSFGGSSSSRRSSRSNSRAHVYGAPSASVLFTLPLRAGVLGVCLHAPVAADYLHLSRLMWPTIPPMVSETA